MSAAAGQELIAGYVEPIADDLVGLAVRRAQAHALRVAADEVELHCGRADRDDEPDAAIYAITDLLRTRARQLTTEWRRAAVDKR